MDKTTKIKKYWEIINKTKNLKTKKKFITTDNLTVEITENGYE